MAAKEDKIPKRYWYEVMDRFTRRDELLVEILKDMRALLKAIPERISVTVTPELIAELKIEAELIDSLARRLQQLPNRLDKIDIDTSKTSDRSLKKLGKLKGEVLLGLWVESIGGGFAYVFQRGDYRSPPKTAVVNERWDMEFDDLTVAGVAAGTASIWVWWREV